MSSSKKRGRGKEIVFDEEARKKYLCGFSERKRQRRAYGLAMQKVKDRKVKLEERREIKQSEMERIEEAERQKRNLLEEKFDDSAVVEESGEGEDNEETTTHETKIKTKTNASTSITFDDAATQSQWGGQVVVTTTVMPMSDCESEDDDRRHRKKEGKPSTDMEQKYAGHVERFLHEFKGKIPGKKKKDSCHRPKRGRHGAEQMKGIGGASNLKVAQKVLTKLQAKQQGKGGGSGRSKDKKNKRR